MSTIDGLTTFDRTTAFTRDARDPLVVQALLNDANLSLSAGVVLHLRRTTDVDYSEVISGVLYHHVGAQYRLVYTAA
jgi:hypothetical protein